MRQYYRCRVEIQGALDHLPGMHLGTVNRAGEEGLMGDKLVLIIQIPESHRPGLNMIFPVDNRKRCYSALTLYPPMGSLLLLRNSGNS